MATHYHFTEEEARQYLEKLRWPDCPVCPHCGGVNARKLEGKSTRAGVHKCRDCRKQFTVTVGTIFERSHLPLRHWVYAFARMCAAKKGISAKQLERELGISYKAAWFMCHRIRHAMLPVNPEPLSGIVEVDETYVGGNPRPGDGKVHKRGRGTSKVPVVALVERGGRVVSAPVTNVTRETFKDTIMKNVAPDTAIYTDEFSGYSGIDEHMASHETVNHSKGQFSRKNGIHSNTVESYFALLKRGIYGTYHHLSRKHLHRYCAEFSFRWDFRKITDAERTVHALQRTDGKRLVFHQIISEDATSVGTQDQG